MFALEIEAYEMDTERTYRRRDIDAIYSREDCSEHVDNVMSKWLWRILGILVIACGIQALVT